MHVHCREDLSIKWTKVEKETLVCLVNAIGPRWYEIAKNPPVRTPHACEAHNRAYRGEKNWEIDPSPEDWKHYWDSESLVHRLVEQTSLRKVQANNFSCSGSRGDRR